MSVKVIYEGETILDVMDEVTKTLQTAGKYLDDDVTIENTPDVNGNGFEEVAHTEFSYNLAEDTSFAEITPSTARQTIKAADSTHFVEFDAVDLQEYDVFAMISAYIDYVYDVEEVPNPHIINFIAKGFYLLARALSYPGAWNSVRTSGANISYICIKENGAKARGTDPFGISVSPVGASAWTAQTEDGTATSSFANRYAKKMVLDVGEVRIQAVNGDMPVSTIAHIDAENTNINVEMTVYKRKKSEGLDFVSKYSQDFLEFNPNTRTM